MQRAEDDEIGAARIESARVETDAAAGGYRHVGMSRPRQRERTAECGNSGERTPFCPGPHDGPAVCKHWISLVLTMLR